MIIARVVGNVWGTKKHAALEGTKLLLVEPIEMGTGKVNGKTSLAVDRYFGAGPGDTVLLIDEGNSARAILGIPSAPIRLVIGGIVDAVTVEGKNKKYH